MEGAVREERENPAEVEPGQVWTVRQEVLDAEDNIVAEVPRTFPVVVISTPDPQGVVRVLPLSLDREFNETPRTFFLTKPLGYPVLAEIFNERPAIVGNLAEFRGNLEKADWRLLCAARKAFWERDLPEPDEDWQKWAAWEVEYAAFLSNPVNEILADE